MTVEAMTWLAVCTARAKFELLTCSLSGGLPALPAPAGALERVASGRYSLVSDGARTAAKVAAVQEAGGLATPGEPCSLAELAWLQRPGNLEQPKKDTKLVGLFVDQQDERAQAAAAQAASAAVGKGRGKGAALPVSTPPQYRFNEG